MLYSYLYDGVFVEGFTMEISVLRYFLTETSLFRKQQKNSLNTSKMS
jgi:hypothetical protein